MKNIKLIVTFLNIFRIFAKLNCIYLITKDYGSPAEIIIMNKDICNRIHGNGKEIYS